MPFSPIRTGIPLIDRNLDQLASIVNPMLASAPVVWTEAKLERGLAHLVNYLAIDRLAAMVAYSIDSAGNTWGKGIVVNGTGGTLASPLIYTLPVGLRPNERRSFIGRTSVAADPAQPFIVDYTGAVSAQYDMANSTWLSLEFSFRAEQ